MDRAEVATDLLRILRGARNGFYYGAKVRMMHSLVMAVLFGRESPLRELRKIATNTLQHGTRLALYVTLYKFTVILLRRVFGSKQKWHHFVAGCVCGYLVFREKNPINIQLVLYLLSRNIVGGAQNLQNRGVLPKVTFFPILGLACWGTVMYLFVDDPKALQSSLTSSMNFLYKDSETWTSWTDFVPFYLPQGVKAALEMPFK